MKLCKKAKFSISDLTPRRISGNEPVLLIILPTLRKMGGGIGLSTDGHSASEHKICKKNLTIYPLPAFDYAQ